MDTLAAEHQTKDATNSHFFSSNPVSSLVFRASHLEATFDKSEFIRPVGRLSSYPAMEFELGSLCEWGMPHGGRELLLEFLSSRFNNKASSAYWSLWINTHPQRRIYPPAWDARGVDLTRVRFADTQKPLHDLKPVFNEIFFKIIVLDIRKNSLSDEDCGYLLRQAKKNKNLIFIVRDYFLSTKRSLVWAKRRFNVIVDHAENSFKIKPLRGILHQDLFISPVHKQKIMEKELCLLP